MTLKIHEPDASGVGEIIAQAPNVMLGYFENDEATAESIKDGWLHTGDLGRFDDDKRLFIVGRKKEMILGASGENVYPDELEELYRDRTTPSKSCRSSAFPSDDGAARSRRRSSCRCGHRGRRQGSARGRRAPSAPSRPSCRCGSASN